jgi:hypothetical protein
MLWCIYTIMRKTSRRPVKAFCEDVAALWPLAKGSVTLVRRPCIRANCLACRSGRKHAGWIFTFRLEGRQHCRYVPKDLAPLLRQAVANGRRLETLVTKAGVEWLERRRQERARNRAGEP